MPSEILAELEASVTAARGAMTSATTLINGIAERVATAVDAAIANGATAEELAPVTTLARDLNADASVLAQAVAANP